jgi:hydrogenase-4 component E
MDGYTLVNTLGGLLILTSLMVILVKSAKKATYLYATQALILVLMLLTLGFVTGSTVLYTWSITAFITKVILVPGIVLLGIWKIGPAAEKKRPPALSPLWMIIIVSAVLLLSFIAVGGIELPTADPVKPALAISLAHFFIGLTCIISQRNIVKQIFGFCLMENGSHVTLALLAPNAPSLVEIGVATDALFAVVIMVVMAVRVYRCTNSLDSNEIMDLKG